MAKLHFDITGDNTNFKRAIDSTKKEVGSLGSYIKKEGTSIDNMFKQMAKSAAAFGAALSAKELLGNIVKVRGEFQLMETSIRTLVGDDMANKLIPQIKELAKVSPLTVSDMTDAERTMLGFNIEAEDTIKYLSAIGDISMGNSERFKSLTLAFSQMSAAGKLMGQDLLQFINAGFNPLQIIAEKTGKSLGELKDAMSEGAISAQMVQQAFIDATSAGGKFYNMSQEASTTINGQLSMIEDSWDEALNKIGTSSESIIMGGLKVTQSLIENYDKIGKILVTLVTTYGAYRTAVMLATVATSKHTLAEVALTNVRILARKAQMALNAAMLTNPYVALATAVTALVGTLWAFAKRSEEATDAQTALQKVSEKAAEEYDAQAAKIDMLTKTLQDDTYALDERKKALKELQSIVPDYHASLTEEGALINSNTQAIQDYLVQLERQVKLEAAREELVELYKRKREQEKELNVAQNNYENVKDLGYVYTGGGVANVNVAAYSADAAKKKVDDANAALGKTKDQITAIEEEIKKITILDDEDAGIKAISTIDDEIASATKKIKELNKELKDLRSGRTQVEAGTTVEAAIKEKESELATVQKTLETLTGKKQKYMDSYESMNAKLAEMELKYMLERERDAVDMENQVEQARIDAMQNGAEKILAQQELDNKKEQEALERAKNEYIQKEIQRQKEIFDAKENLKATLNPDYKKQTFDSTSVSVDTSAFDKLSEYNTAKRTQDNLNAEKQAMNNYLKEYGDYLEKRKAIEEEYQDKIASATTEGDRMLYTRQMKEALSELDIAAKQTTSSISQLFGDMRNKTLKELDKINKSGQDALEFLKTGEWDEAKGAELGITQETFEIWSQSPEKLKAISDALKENREAADDLRPAYDQVANGLEKIFEAGDDSKKLKEGLDDISAGMGTMVNAGAFLQGTLQDLADAFGSDVLGDIAEGLGVALDAIDSAMSGAMAGAIFGPVGAAAGAAIGLVTSLASSIAKLVDKKSEERIQELQNQVEDLQRAYDRLGDAIDKAYSKDASELIEQQNDLLRQQKELIEQQIAEEMGQKNVDDEKLRELRQQLEDLDLLIAENEEKAKDAIWNESLQDAIENFANAYADAWQNGTNKAKSAKEAVRDMMRQMVTESIKAAIDASEAMERIRQKLEEFYSDNVLSDWEQQYIYNMAEELQRELDRQFGWADSLLKENEESQNATAQAFGSEMTHEDANELSGRFAALQISGEEQRKIAAEIKDNVVIIITSLGTLSMTTLEIRTLLQEQNTYVYDIVNYNKKILTTLTSKLESMLDELKRL